MTELESDGNAYDELYVLDNRLMLGWYPGRVVRLAKGDSMLELGLGHGWSTEHFAPRFSRYVVIEGSPEMIARFRSRFDASKIEIVEAYFETFDTSERFDHVNMGFVLEHVEDPGLLLQRYKKLLRPNGSIFISVPNGESLNRRLGVRAGLLSSFTHLAEADLRFGHRRYFTLATLRDLVHANGYEVVAQEGLFLKPIPTSMIEQLALSEAVLQAMLEEGVAYPELSNGLLLEVRPK